jgi:hypothetical protein
MRIVATSGEVEDRECNTGRYCCVGKHRAQARRHQPIPSVTEIVHSVRLSRRRVPQYHHHLQHARDKIYTVPVLAGVNGRR